MDIGQQIMPPLYGVLMSLALSSHTLGEALQYLTRYQGLATGNSGELEYTAIEDHYQLTIAMNHQNPVIRRHVSECVIAMLCGLIKLITARHDLSPIEIQLEHYPYSITTRHHFESTVCCPVSWGTGETRLIIHKNFHRVKIFGHGDELLRLAEKQAQQQLENINKIMTDIEKIKWHVGELMLSSAPRRETIASRLQISTRTLDRRLEEAGISWQEMLDSLRLKAALKYLSDPEITIREISEKLGFSEIRTFQKKFKIWTGLTPTDYRQNIEKTL